MPKIPTLNDLSANQGWHVKFFLLVFCLIPQVSLILQIRINIREMSMVLILLREFKTGHFPVDGLREYMALMGASGIDQKIQMGALFTASVMSGLIFLSSLSQYYRKRRNGNLP